MSRAAALPRSPLRGGFVRVAQIFCENLLWENAQFMQGLCPCTPLGSVTLPRPLQLFEKIFTRTHVGKADQGGEKIYRRQPVTTLGRLL